MARSPVLRCKSGGRGRKEEHGPWSRNASVGLAGARPPACFASGVKNLGHRPLFPFHHTSASTSRMLRSSLRSFPNVPPCPACISQTRRLLYSPRKTNATALDSFPATLAPILASTPAQSTSRRPRARKAALELVRPQSFVLARSADHSPSFAVALRRLAHHVPSRLLSTTASSNRCQERRVRGLDLQARVREGAGAVRRGRRAGPRQGHH